MIDTLVEPSVRNGESGMGASRENIAKIVAQFAIESPTDILDFPDKGNINRHTYLVLSGINPQREYLLQMVNPKVFVNPPQLMASMVAAIEAQRECLSRAAKGGSVRPEVRRNGTKRSHAVPAAGRNGHLSAGRSGALADQWEPITLIPTRGGDPYLALESADETQYWRLMVKIQRAHTYKSLSEISEPATRLRVAHEAGRGLAQFGAMMSSVKTSGLASSLPGYRDTQNYYNQLFSILEGHRTLEQARGLLPRDESLVHSTGSHFLVHAPAETYARRRFDPKIQDIIARAVDEREFGLTLAREMASGGIRTVAIHGDTKLDNFLFCTATGRVRAIVDLDTIMPHTWLADWGDMARSLVNVAGEKERNLSQVQVDREIFGALATGFLGAGEGVTSRELDLMVDSVQIIALELAVRFLADYLRGDTYFQLGPDDPDDLNLLRAMVQFTLFLRLRDAADECRSRIEEARR